MWIEDMIAGVNGEGGRRRLGLPKGRLRSLGEAVGLGMPISTESNTHRKTQEQEEEDKEDIHIYREKDTHKDN
jgi:hypothetical protein